MLQDKLINQAAADNDGRVSWQGLIKSYPAVFGTLTADQVRWYVPFCSFRSSSVFLIRLFLRRYKNLTKQQKKRSSKASKRKRDNNADDGGDDESEDPWYAPDHNETGDDEDDDRPRK